MPKPSPIGEIADAATRKEFADALARHTSLTTKEVQDLFPKKADQEELLELLKIVSSAANDNEKKARLIERIGDVAGAVIKITKKVATGLG